MSFSGMNGPKHTFWAGPWRYCVRCDRKEKIANMRWQRGKLLCPHCFDDWPLLGQRDAAIAAVLTDGRGEQELAPVEKLRNPTEFESLEDFSL